MKRLKKQEIVMRAIYITLFLSFMASFILLKIPMFYFFLGVSLFLVVKSVVQLVPVRLRMTPSGKRLRELEERRLGPEWAKQQRKQGKSNAFMLFILLISVMGMDLNATVDQFKVIFGVMVIFVLVVLIFEDAKR